MAFGEACCSASLPPTHSASASTRATVATPDAASSGMVSTAVPLIGSK